MLREVQDVGPSLSDGRSGRNRNRVIVQSFSPPSLSDGRSGRNRNRRKG